MLDRITPPEKPITTTLNRIREKSPCQPGWAKLLKGLGKTSADDEPLPFATILRINGLDDALWCLCAEPQHSPTWRLMAVRFARTVEHLMNDQRSLNAIIVAERHACGEAPAAAKIALDEIQTDFGIVQALVTIEGALEDWRVVSVEVPSCAHRFARYLQTRQYFREDWEQINERGAWLEREFWRAAKAEITEDMATDALRREMGE